LGEQNRLFFNSKRPQLLFESIQFDDLETFEHTKCRPISILLAVESGTRRIIELDVASMPAKGLLASIALKKYGKRKDERWLKREDLFKRLKPRLARDAEIKSDQNPHYLRQIKRHFPDCVHQTFKGRKSALTAQGELKKIGFDPIFSLNHTCAMFRANINRLFRKTWCTTKRIDRLADHLFIYANFHNERIEEKLKNRAI